ncbi:MAG: metal-dependent hydrolase [Anaerolineales bacterium]|nr:metal-dependent hydrolase [Anaerolineales bacterium]
MNYVHHAVIGVGTASLGVAAAELLGAPLAVPAAVAFGAVTVILGSIAVDIDHPKSYISNTIPTRVIRLAIAGLSLPALVAVGVYLTTRDLQGAWTQFTAAVFGVAILRWMAVAMGAALALMGLSWVLCRSLHHRGPLHSLVFTAGVTLVACLACWGVGLYWWWGLWFGWGWLWHILADGLTEAGVPLLWPFRDQRLHVLPRWGRRIGQVLLSLAAILGIVGLITLRLHSFID